MKTENVFGTYNIPEDQNESASYTSNPNTMKQEEGNAGVEKSAKFAMLKYQVGETLVSKFLEYNDGKFHTGLEFNPATHALTELCESYCNEQNAELRQSLRELITIAEKYYGIAQFNNWVHHPQVKSAINNAKAILEPLK